MTDQITVTEDHNVIYRLLLYQHTVGLTRERLVQLTGFGDRKVRKLLEDLRIIAEQQPHPELGPLCFGYDKQFGVYTYAKTREQADRIMGEYHSRLTAMSRALAAQQRAANARFGASDGSVQEALFEAQKTLNRGAWS